MKTRIQLRRRSRRALVLAAAAALALALMMPAGSIVVAPPGGLAPWAAA